MSKLSIDKILEKIGFTPKESDIYNTMLKIGMSSAPTIARELNIPRQTAYHVLQQMTEKGFINQSNEEGVNMFFAEPSSLLSLLELRKRENESTQKMLEKEMPYILEQSQSHILPKVQYFQGKKGLKSLFQNILNYYKGKVPREFRGYGVNHLKGLLEDDFLQGFIKDRYRKYKVNTRLLIADTDDDFDITNQRSRYGREVKYLDIDEQQAGAYIVGSRTYIFSYKNNFGIMIEDEIITKLLRDVFDYQWKKLK